MSTFPYDRRAPRVILPLLWDFLALLAVLSLIAVGGVVMAVLVQPVVAQ